MNAIIIKKGKLIAALFALLSFINASAQEITVDKAKENVQNFLNRTTGTRLPQKATAKNMELAYIKNKDTRPLYYVFNLQQGGFIITSADERANEILGYVTEGTFDIGVMPDNMRWWLEQYAEQIDAVCNKPVNEHLSTRTTRAVGTTIKPFITAVWDQTQPFNDMCYYNSTNGKQKALTGCVATAMAQVMHYYRWPETGAGSNSYEYNITEGGLSLMQHYESDFSRHTYDWNNMVADYSKGNYNENQATAVAQLMFDCGVSVNARYGNTETNAQPQNIDDALIENFGYSPTTSLLYRVQVSDDEWESRIYNELRSGRPVIYSGFQDNNTGHTFVCDGYKEGLYHFNWGWSGHFNGFFNLTGAGALTPDGTGAGGGTANTGYTYNQSIITGITPANNEGGVIAKGELTLSQTSATHNDMLFVSGELVNAMSATDVYMAVELINTSTGARTIIGATDYTFAAGTTIYGLMFSASDIIENGTYEVIPVYRASNSNVWRQADMSSQTTTMTLTLTGQEPELYVTKPISFTYGTFTSLANIKLRVNLKALADINGRELIARFIQPWNGETAGTLNATVALKKGEETEITLLPSNISGLSEGMTYELILYSYENGIETSIPTSDYTVIKNAQIVTANEKLQLGIGDVSEENKLVDVYSTDGVIIKQNVKADEALNNLPTGIYIVNGQKTLVK